MRESFRNSPSFRRSMSPTVNVTAFGSFWGNDKTCAILASACTLPRTLRLHFSCTATTGHSFVDVPGRAQRPRTRDREPSQDSDLLFTLFVDVNGEGTRTRHDCTVVSHSAGRQRSLSSATLKFTPSQGQGRSMVIKHRSREGVINWRRRSRKGTHRKGTPTSLSPKVCVAALSQPTLSSPPIVLIMLSQTS